MKRLALLALVALSGCKLDFFIYTPPRVEAYKLEAAGDSPEETVTADRIEPVRITVTPEISLGAAYLKGSEQPPRAHVLYFHGKGGHLDSSFGRAKRWANLGFDVLVFDYRGFGNSTNVEPTEAGIAEDTEAALQYLVSRVGASARIVFYGHSFGTAAGLQRAVLSPPRALILESALVSIQYFVADSSQMDLPDSFFMKASWSGDERIAKLQVPVLLLHGLADDYVRPEGSEALYGEANEPKKLVLVEGADHGTVPEVMDRTFAGTEGTYGGTIHGFLDAYAR